MKKCAFIRSKDKNDCPFGLPIVSACKCAGSAVSNMCPLEMVQDKKEAVEKANMRVYIYYKTGQPCIYAANIIKDKEVVNCNYSDSAAGMHTPMFEGSPLYAQFFASTNLDALYAYPMGYYGNNTSRNLFQGLFSLVGNKFIEIIKQALPKRILEKLGNNIQLTKEEELEVNKKFGI